MQFAAKMIPQTQASGVNGNDGMLMLYVRLIIYYVSVRELYR